MKELGQLPFTWLLNPYKMYSMSALHTEKVHLKMHLNEHKWVFHIPFSD